MELWESALEALVDDDSPDEQFNMKNASDVLREDLQFICDSLREEFGQMSGKRLLITGGAGFLGYYLVQSLVSWNDGKDEALRIELTVLDNNLLGMPAWLAELDGNGSLFFVKHDITKPLPGSLGGYQYIIHAASIASPTYYRKYPIETMDANVNGLRNLLDLCNEQKADGMVEGFLFYSSSEVYGDPTPENIPTPETYFGNVSCVGPRACYDESKRYGETLCYNYARQFDIPVKIARPFNNFGPGLKITDGRVIPDFARDVIEGRDIAIYSDGMPRRTFCYVADAIIGYYKILVKGEKGEAYNIGAEGPEVSVLELAERIARISKDLFGYDGKVTMKKSADKEYLVNNPSRRRPLIDKAWASFGYSPKIPLDEGLRRSLIWYRENRGEERHT